MTQFETTVITALLAASAGCILVPFLIYILHRFMVKPSWEGGRVSGLSHLLVFSGCLIASVWLLRFAVGYFGISHPELSAIAPEAEFAGLTWWEEIMNSFIHALQTFSMDEDYTAYIISGKTMVREMSGGSVSLENAFGIYASVLNLVAPIAGGAVVFDILASISPKIRLWLCRGVFWKEKCYFSELNEYSLALAKSIAEVKGRSLLRPILVFTDAYADDEDEKASESLNEARKLGAICLKDDLSHVKKNRLGKKMIFLIDKDEVENLQTLTAFADPYNSRDMKNSTIYLFVNDDAYVQVEGSVCAKLKTCWNMEDVADENLPISIVPVRSYRNMISNLLVDYPLYEPLIGKKNDGHRSLAVTILGMGHIGTEMFLSTYWFGQILDCSLTIRIVSQETEEEFWDRIDCVNPEIRHTTQPGDQILRVNQREDLAEPYCTVKYLECDVRTSKFIDSLHPGENSILDTDYYLVALGSDEENISTANTVRKYVAENRISQANTREKEAEKREKRAGEGNDTESNSPMTFIACVVYNTALADTLNQQMKSEYGNCARIYMRAIGSLKEVYSERNVFLNEHTDSARVIHESYLAAQRTEEREKLKSRIKDDYKFWANVARHCHVKYKMFSLGVIDEPWIELDEKEKKARSEEAYKKCRDLVLSKFTEMSEKDRQDFMALMHRMAWLEHRRWNAFTRVMGFRGSTDYGVYGVPGVHGSYKEMKVKLHPCLLECDQKGMRVRQKEDGTAERITEMKTANGGHVSLSPNGDFDLLDKLSWDLIEKDLNGFDLKQYDYPDDDFGLGKDPQCQLAVWLHG